MCVCDYKPTNRISFICHKRPMYFSSFSRWLTLPTSLPSLLSFSDLDPGQIFKKTSGRRPKRTSMKRGKVREPDTKPLLESKETTDGVPISGRKEASDSNLKMASVSCALKESKKEARSCYVDVVRPALSLEPVCVQTHNLSDRVGNHSLALKKNCSGESRSAIQSLSGEAYFFHVHLA